MVLLDGREVLDAVGTQQAILIGTLSLLFTCKKLLLFHHRILFIGIPNKRQSHDLTLSSAYSGYSIGGEPHYTASMPSEKNKIGTECLDYIFYSTGKHFT